MSSRRGAEQLKRQALTDVFNVLEKRKGAIAEQQETFRKEKAIEDAKVDVTVGDRSFRVDPGDAFKHFSKLEEKKKAGDVTVPVKIDTPEGSRTFNVKEKDALDYYAEQAEGPEVKTESERAWRAYQKRTGEDIPFEQFKSEKLLRESGQLSEEAALRQLAEIAEYDPEKTARWTNRFKQLKDIGMDNFESLEQVQRESIGIMGEETDFSYGWE